jgi:uncharacterized transporter YbjL
MQGWYYLIVGLLTALALGTLQSPVTPVLELSHMWSLRILGAFLALAGIGLIRASRRVESISLAIGGPIIIAGLIALVEVITISLGVLPTTFLLDAGMEFGFLVWWTLAMYHGSFLVHSTPSSMR